MSITQSELPSTGGNKIMWLKVQRKIGNRNATREYAIMSNFIRQDIKIKWLNCKQRQEKFFQQRTTICEKESNGNSITDKFINQVSEYNRNIVSSMLGIDKED